MKSSSRYALAFTLALLPLAVWFGGESVEQERVEVCLYCDSTHHLTERRWFVWGWRGNEVLRDEMEPSPVLRDFPAFRCSHDWSHVGTKNFQEWDSPLCAIYPSLEPGKVISFCGEIPVPLLYNEDAGFRALLNEAIEDEFATRDQVARWLELGSFNSPGGPGPDEDEDEDEAAAFKKLDAIIHGRLRTAGPAFNPLPLPVLPPRMPREIP